MSGGSSALANGEGTADTDPARMVSLVLGESEKRKKAVQKSQARQTLTVPAVPEDSGLPATTPGRSRTVSPSRSFRMLGRSPSQGRKFMQSLSSSNSPVSPVPSSPPPAPGRASFPSPSLSSAPFQSSSTQRRSLGQQQLRELKSQFKFTEATLQRTLKAKQVLQLSALYKRLLEIQSPSEVGVLGVDASAVKHYNPLQVIRNRKARNRKKIQLDLAPWEDPGTVEQWIEDVAVSQYSPGPDGGMPKPPPVQGPAKKMKRPRMDWIVTPQEMLADNYWEESEKQRLKALEREREHAEKKRRRHKSIGDVEELVRKSVEMGSREEAFTGGGDSPDDEPRESWDSPRRRRAKDAMGDYRAFLKAGDEKGYESTATSTDTSSSESSISTSDLESATSPKKDKHHRRRRQLKKVLTGGRSGKTKQKEKKKLSRQELELEEVRRQKAADEIEGMGAHMRSSLDRDYLLSPEHLLASDDEYDSTPPKLYKTGTESTSYSIPNHSKSSLERFVPGSFGERRQETVDYVVPSIAINLTPPRKVTREDEERDEKERNERDRKRWRKIEDIVEHDEGGPLRSQSKRLPPADDDGSQRDSLDFGERYLARKPADALGRVKTRVEKIRKEVVAKVKDDYIGRVSMPSPSASSFEDSLFGGRTDDEGGIGGGAMTDDDGLGTRLARGRSSLEVPSNGGPGRYRSSYSTGQLPTYDSLSGGGRRSLESDSGRSLSPEKYNHRPLYISRDPSPARRVVIEPLGPREGVNLPSSATDAYHASEHATSLSPLPPILPPNAGTTTATTAGTPTRPRTPPAVSKRSIHESSLDLVRTGIVARALIARTPACTTAHARTARATAARIDALASGGLKRTTAHLTHRTAPRLAARFDAEQRYLSAELTPRVRAIADEADGMSARVTTELTLAVKTVSDEVVAVLRKRKRRVRIIRRIGWALLEWVLLAVMWAVWLGVVLIRVGRGVLRATIRISRWVLWI